MIVRMAVLIVALSGAAPPPDQLATARRLYNEGQYDQALAAAHEAEENPATVSAARLVIGRICLERYRRTADGADLDAARSALRTVDPRALEPRERTELQVGFAELLYLGDHFGAAAELLWPVLDATNALGPEAHERALDWWATALDRDAQNLAADDRPAVYARISKQMLDELKRDPASSSANYWVAAAARGERDLDRAMAAASAAWVRGAIARDRGASLRADVDRLVTQALIPDRAARLTVRDKRQAIAGMVAEWEAFKAAWLR